MKKETRPTPGSSFSSPEIENLLFGKLDDGTLRRMGFNPREVTNWGIAIFKGEVPNGFQTLEEFKEHVQSRLTQEKKSDSPKKGSGL